jgi:hypothetical protein
MTEKIDTEQFSQELNKRLDEVIAWAVMTCPLNEINLAYADFEKVRSDFQQVALGQAKPHKQEASEPEDGGPQYVNDNPTPWP